MKWLSYIAFGLLVCQASAQDLNKPVDYRTVAVPTARALAEIGKQTGIIIQVDEPMASQPVILRLKQVPLKRTLDEIAGVLGAEWRVENKAIVLFRVPSLRDFLFNRWVKGCADRMRRQLAKNLEETSKSVPSAKDIEALADRLEQLDPKAKDGYDRARDLFMYGFGPEEILESIVWRAISVDEVVASADDEVVDFSTSPVGEEHLLPISEEELGAAADLINAASRVVFQADRFIPRPDNDDFFSAPKPVRAQGARVSARILSEDNTWLLSAQWQAADGEVVLETLTYLEAPWLDKEVRSVPPGLEDVKEVKASPLTLEARAILASRRSTPRIVVGPSATMREALLGGDPIDPLALDASDLLLGIGDAKQSNVVASPTDNLTGLSQIYRASATATQMLAAVADSGCSIEFNDGWLRVGPTYPLVAERMRASRPAMTELLRAVDAEPEWERDTLAEYAPTDQTDGTLAQLLLALLHPDRPNVDPTSRGLKIWGCISDAHRKVLLKGDTIPLASVTGDLFDQITQAVNRAGGSIDSQCRVAPSGALVSIAPADLLSVFDRATASLRLGSRKTEHVFVDRGEGLKAVSSRTIAAERARGTFNKSWKFTWWYDDVMLIYVDIRPGLSVLVESKVPKQGNSVPEPYDSLPESFRQKVDRQTIEASQRPDTSGQGGDDPPPAT